MRYRKIYSNIIKEEKESSCTIFELPKGLLYCTKDICFKVCSDIYNSFRVKWKAFTDAGEEIDSGSFEVEEKYFNLPFQKNFLSNIFTVYIKVELFPLDLKKKKNLQVEIFSERLSGFSKDFANIVDSYLGVDCNCTELLAPVSENWGLNHALEETMRQEMWSYIYFDMLEGAVADGYITH